jgi:cytochrome c553
MAVGGLIGVIYLTGVDALYGAEITGETVYKHCVACHGARGEGGKEGVYPRIAGLPQGYLERQLRDFQSQQRVNKPMIPIFKHERFDDQVIETVAAYVAAMAEPPLNLWPYQPAADALQGFKSRSAFDAAGKAAYESGCAGCHGTDGSGEPAKAAPPLVNQYTAYLDKQIRDFAAGKRVHPRSDDCASIAPDQREGLFSHLVELGK